MDRNEFESDPMKFASMVAHQLNSPVAAVRTLLRTLLDGYVGPLTDKQRDAISRALARCDQASEASRRMMAIAHALQDTQQSHEITDLAQLVRHSELRYTPLASQRDIRFSILVETPRAQIYFRKAVLTEALNAILDNAFKYTPDGGRVRVRVSEDSERQTIRLSVSDSGVGIREEDRPKVFDTFFRSSTARQSTRPGTGLGLAFVKSVVEAAGGNIELGKSDLGGTEVTIVLPLVEPEDLAVERREIHPLRVLIVGGVAAGPKAAAKIIRMVPDAEVTVVEMGQFLSYAGCGLPYYVSGEVKDQKELMSSPLGGVRDPVFFQNVKNVRILSRTRAMEIDRKDKCVLVRDETNGEQSRLEYDKLVLATGASPMVPDIPGVKLGNVFKLHGVRDAEGIRARLAEERAHDVVIVGGGLLGVEATEAITRKGARVTIVEMQQQILGMLDWEIAKLVEHHLQANGVKVLDDTHVRSIEGDEDGNVRAVVTDRGTLSADMVVLAIGVRPNIELAEKAGLKLGETGAVMVDDRMCTSDPDIYAAGDCVESVDLLTGRACYFPLGSTANKQARVAAINLCGGEDHFPGVLGSTVCKVFDFCVAKTGLTESAAKQLGYDVVTTLTPAPDRAHYMPDARQLLLKLVVDRKTARLLGAQGVGAGNADKRIDVAAMALTAGLTVHQLANADLCYAPPYSPAMDNIITAANVARNKLDGFMVGVSPVEVHRMIEEGSDFVFLDCRTPGEYEHVRLPGATLIPLGSLRARLDELPRNKEIVTFCEISLRGYEAAIILRSKGFENVRVMDGGVAMWPFQKIHE